MSWYSWVALFSFWLIALVSILVALRGAKSKRTVEEIAEGVEGLNFEIFFFLIKILVLGSMVLALYTFPIAIWLGILTAVPSIIVSLLFLRKLIRWRKGVSSLVNRMRELAFGRSFGDTTDPRLVERELRVTMKKILAKYPKLLVSLSRRIGVFLRR